MRISNKETTRDAFRISKSRIVGKNQAIMLTMTGRNPASKENF